MQAKKLTGHVDKIVEFAREEREQIFWGQKKRDKACRKLKLPGLGLILIPLGLTELRSKIMDDQTDSLTICSPCGSKRI